MRQALDKWLDRPIVGNFIIAVIIVNAIVLGLETSKPIMAQFGGLILAIDQACLARLAQSWSRVADVSSVMVGTCLI